MGKTSLFAALLFCADCHSKLYYFVAKSIPDGKEFYRCLQYKENRGSCSIHYIGDNGLKETVLEAIRRVAGFVQEFERIYEDNVLGKVSN